MKRKVYLLTFHGSVNYGAALQAYALSRAIGAMGGECVVIDYNRKTHHRNYLRLPKSIKGALYQAQFLPDKILIHHKFNRFVKKNLHMTEESYDGYEQLLTAKFEKDALFIVGSDQVWNYDMTGRDTHYFLDFTENANKYSYAASFGVNRLSEEAIAVCKPLLEKFRSITVREETGKLLLQEQMELNGEVICDPTLLLNAEQWKEICKPCRDKGFIALFMFGYNKNMVEYAKTIAKKKNLRILNMVYGTRGIKGTQDVRCLGPDEWLGYLQAADYVVTNSFHGFVISLNLEKQVWVALTQGGRNSRITDLAKRYGIVEHIIDNDMCGEVINYSVVNQMIQRDRKNALDVIGGIVGVK